jgi:cytochrome c2
VLRDQDFGPSLDGIGTKVNLPWLRAWLADPESYLDYPRMPKFRLNDEQIEAVAAFLWKHTWSPMSFPEGLDLEAGDYDRGLARFRESRCISCHSVEGKGGGTALELGRVADKIRPDWLYGFIRNPHSYYPHTQMLQYNFNDQDVLDIVAYMMEEFTEGEPEEENGSLAASDPSLEEKGEVLFAKLGCRGCHEIGDVPFQGKIGPDLSHVGSADMETVDFPDTSTASRTVPNWVFLKLKTPGAAGLDPKMPSFSFSDREAAALTVALMSLRKETIPEDMVIQEPPARVFNPQGEFGRIFKKYRCLSCHEVFGYGGTLSTAPLEMEGSRVLEDWLYEYMQVPYAIRPTVEERMPRFRMSDREARVLAEYFNSVLVDDSVLTLSGEELTEAEALLGVELFQKKGCRGCHIVGNTGGYVGPHLNNTGGRLKPGWLVTWLMMPLEYKPETIHPDYSFSFEEAKAIAAYLGTLKEQ